MTKYMTTKEAAAAMEVSSATVVRWVRDGLIPAKRFGLRVIKIPRVEIEQLVNQEVCSWSRSELNQTRRWQDLNVPTSDRKEHETSKHYLYRSI